MTEVQRPLYEEMLTLLDELHLAKIAGIQSWKTFADKRGLSRRQRVRGVRQLQRVFDSDIKRLRVRYAVKSNCERYRAIYETRTQPDIDRIMECQHDLACIGVQIPDLQEFVAEGDPGNPRYDLLCAEKYILELALVDYIYAGLEQGTRLSIVDLYHQVDLPLYVIAYHKRFPETCEAPTQTACASLPLVIKRYIEEYPNTHLLGLSQRQSVLCLAKDLLDCNHVLHQLYFDHLKVGLLP